MPITVKATAKNNAGSIVIPASASVGDLFLIGCGAYNGYWIFPAAVTSIGSYTTFGTGSYNIYLSTGYMIIGAGQAGTTITLTNNGASSSYTSIVGVLITGHDAANPILGNNVNSSATNQTTCGTQSVTNITSRAMGFYFMAQMNTGAVAPTWSSQSSHTQIDSQIGNQNVHQGTIAYRDSTISAIGSTIGPSAATVPNSSNIGRVIAVKEGNYNPVVTSQTPKNYDAIGNVQSALAVSWTYSDYESNTQYRYEISYRPADSTGAYTTITSANGVTSTTHTFAANTFTDGVEYEWRLRLDDNQGSGWSPYYTAYFTAGTSKWNYGPQITSSSSTSVTTTRTFATYDFESGTQGWQNNPFFGTYADCTFTNSTTRPKAGTRSMEITWPTTTGQTRLASPSISGFKIGATYRIEADVYVPAGSPLVRLDPFLQTDGKGGVILDKDSWVTAWCEFQAVNESITFAVVAEQTTSGQKVFMDNFRVVGLTPEPGNYQLSVRTSDGVGYGAWSAPSNTFAVRTGPVAEYLSLTPQRVGSNITVNWKYRDVDSQAQTKYKVRYRKK